MPALTWRELRQKLQDVYRFQEGWWNVEGTATANIGGEPAVVDPRDQEIADLQAQVAALQAAETAEDNIADMPGYTGAERGVPEGPRRTGPADRPGRAVAARARAAGDPRG